MENNTKKVPILVIVLYVLIFITTGVYHLFSVIDSAVTFGSMASFGTDSDFVRSYIGVFIVVIFQALIALGLILGTIILIAGFKKRVYFTALYLIVTYSIQLMVALIYFFFQTGSIGNSSLVQNISLVVIVILSSALFISKESREFFFPKKEEPTVEAN